MRTFLVVEIILISCSIVPATCSTALAELITFQRDGDFNDPLIDGLASGSITRLGLTATFTASDGVLNATSTNFGINASGSGDVTGELDNGSGVVEFITINFDQPVTFTQLTLDSFSGSERASLTVGLNAARILDATTAGTDVYDFSNADFPLGNLIDTGQTLIIGYTFGSAADNGFSLEGFHVNTVPEPSAMGCALPVLIGGWLRRKRR